MRWIYFCAPLDVEFFKIGFFWTPAAKKKKKAFMILQIQEEEKKHLLFRHAIQSRKFTMLLQMKVRLCDK